MSEQAEFTRITIDPGQMGGQPCIRGLRIPVDTVVSMVESGMSTEEVIAALPKLDAADVDEALRFDSRADPSRE